MTTNPHPQHGATARRPRHRLWWLVPVLFVGVPLVEIVVIVEVGQAIGAWWTVLLLVADSLFGAWLLRREGVRAWRALREALRSGRPPARELADGVLLLVGGTLMLTPGFVTDAFGLLCVLPGTRPVARRALTRLIASRLLGASGPGGTGGPGFATGSGPADATRPSPRPPGSRPGGSGDVVTGEVVDPPETDPGER